MTDNVIDVDGLLANSDPNGLNVMAEFTSASGAAFTVAAGGLDTGLYHHLCRWPHFVG